MRHLAFAAALSIAVLSLAGCKSQQHVQQGNAADLQAQWKALDAQYSKECYDPYSTVAGGDSTKKAFSGEWTKADEAAFQKKEAETKARIASAPCQTLDEKRKDVGNRMVAARSAAR